jgi:phosphotransferase system HPr (HPr) family protein
MAVNVAEASVEVKNRLGLHLRAVSTLVKTLVGFSSTVTLIRGKQQVNARSVTALLMLGAGKGTKLKVKAEGEDAREAIAAVKQAFEEGFGED